MKEKYSLSTPAKRSLQQITKYTEERFGTTQRRKYIKALFTRFDYLAEYPKRGLARDDVQNGLRSYVEGKHVIYYFTRKAHIEITDILHSSMEPRG